MNVKYITRQEKVNVLVLFRKILKIFCIFCIIAFYIFKYYNGWKSNNEQENTSNPNIQ